MDAWPMKPIRIWSLFVSKCWYCRGYMVAYSYTGYVRLFCAYYYALSLPFLKIHAERRVCGLTSKTSKDPIKILVVYLAVFDAFEAVIDSHRGD